MTVTSDLNLLGIPESWWFIHYGLMPFIPERSIVLKQLPYCVGEAGRKQLLEELMAEQEVFHHGVGLAFHIDPFPAQKSTCQGMPSLNSPVEWWLLLTPNGFRPKGANASEA